MSKITGNEPQLPSQNDQGQAPALGGNRAKKACSTCGQPMLRDMFGAFICLNCREPSVPRVQRVRLETDPAWFRAGKWIPAIYIRRVRDGLHPTGAKIHPDQDYDLKGLPRQLACGTCQHLHRSPYHNKTYLKCELHRENWTHSGATDIRYGWPACEHWQAKESDHE